MKNIAKKIICFGLLLVMLFSFMSCSNNSSEGKAFGEKPEGFDEPMPELWEEELSGKEFDFSTVDVKTAREITIGSDVTNVDPYTFYELVNLENIYVEEGNEKFASDDGVLYSKSYQTLYKWPAKKPVTEVRDTVKYFAIYCFIGCDMPEDFEIPDGTIKIGKNAFYKTNLTKLHIKSNVKSVDYQNYPETCKTIEISTPIVYASFYTHSHTMATSLGYSIETIIFNEGVKQIRPNRNKNLVKSIYENREYLYKMMFAKNIQFPSTLEAIGNVSFPVNVNVASYEIPESVVYIDKNAFDDYYVKQGFVFGCARRAVIAREVNTEFDCRSDVATEYVAANISKWQRTTK